MLELAVANSEPPAMCRLRVGLGPSAKEGPPGEVHLELEVISDHASSARVLTDHRVSGDANLLAANATVSQRYSAVQ